MDGFSLGGLADRTTPYISMIYKRLRREQSLRTEIDDAVLPTRAIGAGASRHSEAERDAEIELQTYLMRIIHPRALRCLSSTVADLRGRANVRQCPGAHCGAMMPSQMVSAAVCHK
jgi:hypothetical protein